MFVMGSVILVMFAVHWHFDKLKWNKKNFAFWIEKEYINNLRFADDIIFIAKSPTRTTSHDQLHTENHKIGLKWTNLWLKLCLITSHTPCRQRRAWNSNSLHLPWPDDPHAGQSEKWNKKANNNVMVGQNLPIWVSTRRMKNSRYPQRKFSHIA